MWNLPSARRECRSKNDPRLTDITGKETGTAHVAMPPDTTLDEIFRAERLKKVETTTWRTVAASTKKIGPILVDFDCIQLRGFNENDVPFPKDGGYPL